MTRWRRMTSVLLVFCMMFTMLPALAEEEEITSPGLSVVETEAPSGEAAQTLFDGIPEYELDGECSIKSDSELDSGAEASWEELAESFLAQPETEGISGEEFDGGGLDGGASDSVGDLDGGEDAWNAPGLSDGGEELSQESPPDGTRDPDAPGGGLDGGSAPSGYRMKISSNKCLVGSYITFYTEFSNTTSAYLILKDRNTGKSTSYRVGPNVTYRMTFSSAGSYALYLILYNSYGMYDGSKHNGTLYVKSGKAPQPYWMSISDSSLAVNRPLTVKIDRKNADKATLVIKNTSNGNKVVYSGSVGSSFQFRFTGAGRYSLHLVTENEFGTYDGSRYSSMILYCTVTGGPVAYSWTLTGASKIAPNGSTTIRVDSLGGADSATVVMERGGTVVSRTSITGPRTLTVKPGSKTGTYVLYLITQNSSGSYNGKAHGKTISISVTGTPSDYSLSISKLSCYVGESLTFWIDPKNSNYYYFVIERNGSVIYQKNHGLAKGITFTPSQAGAYLFYLITYNNFGSFNGKSKYSLTCQVLDKGGQGVFSMKTNGYSFSNSAGDLGYRYNTDKMSLESYNAVLGGSLGPQKWRDSGPWGGSCFGFSSTSAWAYQYPGANFSQRFNSSTIYGIPAPKNRNSQISKTLERYQISQLLPGVIREGDANLNQVSKLANAVEASEKGGPMVILGVYSLRSGHAIVPYEHHTSGSMEIFTVYDCNLPGQTKTISMTKNANGTLRSFSYNNGYVYNQSFTFFYADTVRSAMPSSARDGAANEDSSDWIVTLTGTPGSAVCANANGQTVDLAGHEILLCDAGPDSRAFRFPAGKYTLTCESETATEYSCLVSNYEMSASATAAGKAVTFYIGEQNGGVQCSARSDTKGNIHMSLSNSGGQLSYLDAAANYLGVALDGTGSMQANSDAGQIEHNGGTLSLSWSGEGSSDLDGSGEEMFSVTANAFLTGSDGSLDGGDDLLSIESTPSVRLEMTDRGILGSLILLTNNPGGVMEREVRVSAYDGQDNLIGTEQAAAAIGAGKSVAEVVLAGGISPLELLAGNLKFKVELLEEDGETTAAETVFEQVALAGSGFDGAAAGQLSLNAAPGVQLSAVNGGIAGTLTLSTSNPGQAMTKNVYVAAYDGNNRMIGVEETAVEIKSGTGTAVAALKGSIPAGRAAGPLTFKVFLLDEEARPMCGAATFTNVSVK